jgi:hypothetical protein
VPAGDTAPGDLLRQGRAARGTGDLDAARAAFASAFDAARAASDVDAMTEAALALAAGQVWGTVPGIVPAFLHEAYGLAGGRDRTRLAIALARAWVNAGNLDRARGFAREAVADAEAIGNPALLAEALDAELLVHWGPDDLDERLRITARLEDVAAHVPDVEARLSLHLWRLTTALEVLDLVAVQRQLRALDLLAEETGSARVRFFAASRRGMAALLSGDIAAATALVEVVTESGTAAGEPDLFALEHTLLGGIARVEGDVAALATEAQVYEEFGCREGSASVSAQAAVLWLEAGEAGRASRLLHQTAGPDFAHLVRDVEWLLTMVSLTGVAAATGADDLTAIGYELIEPYAGRAVVNAGAVGFEGVVDDYLAHAAASLGRTDDAARWEAMARGAYQRLDAPWWLDRLDQGRPPPSDSARFHLRPGGDRIWLVGRDRDPVAVSESKGLRYLNTILRRPGVPVLALDLSDAAAGHASGGVREGDHGEVIDRQALDTYRRRLAELDAELGEAEAWSDTGRFDALAVERDALLDQVSAAVGLGGRTRRTGDSAERARTAVRKAIASAIARIEDVDPATARVLRDTVRTGTTCSYDPDPARPIDWVLD